ncbi:MAG TPA: phosphoribosyltransferase [Trebonia sp.]
MFCRTCRGPAGDGFARCYQCELALREAGGLLADVVVPVGYAVRGGALAEDLRRYKSDRVDAAQAAAAAGRLGAMLAAFLAEYGAGVWAAAGMRGGPAAVAVVPSGQGRPGTHPLGTLVRSGLDLPLVPLAVRPGEVHGRGVNADWVRVGGRVTGADLLVADDTWVSGGSAQSVAAALKRAGAGRVAVVVLGRHVNAADPRSETFLRALSPGASPLRQSDETMTAAREGDCRAVRLADLHQAGDR